MRTFSSILPFTNRFGLRRATCMTNGAQGGEGGANERVLVEFGLSGVGSTIGDMLRCEEKWHATASDLAIHRIVWALLAEERPIEDGQILIYLRHFIAAFNHDPTEDEYQTWLSLVGAEEVWGMRVVARHLFKPPYPPSYTVEHRIKAFEDFHKRLDAIVGDHVLHNIIKYAANKFGNKHSPSIKITPPQKNAWELDVMRDFDLEARPAALDQS